MNKAREGLTKKQAKVVERIIVGFSILSFAPMPLFSTYGVLSAFMISFAMLSSILILPSLLLIVTRNKK